MGGCIVSGVIELPGVESSRAIREQLATEGRPVLLAFSGGKDALASWLALRESGIPVLPYYMYYVPGLRFVEDYLTYCESIFGCRIARYPHPSLYRWLNRFVFQAPERLAIIEAAQLPEPTYEQMLTLVREDQGLPADTWVADGVRAADSIVRRLSVQKHGAMKSKHHKVSVVWDWRKAHVFDAITSAGIDLALDYEWFGRSFDGIDARFTGPLREHAPEDFERILEWFPLAELDLVRQELAS
jgi:hypothetical protein